MEYGAIPHLIALLLSPNHDVREQSAWCLGNVAGDGPNLRDHAIKNGAILPIVSNINQPANISLLRNCTWYGLLYLHLFIDLFFIFFLFEHVQVPIKFLQRKTSTRC